ncbi:MAG: hypothetical protein NC324_02710 [Bacteroides sp.]|nr:hypothetical protein [Bacteroides sp.]
MRKKIDDRFSFRRGWLQVKNGDMPEVKRRLMAAMGTETRAGWCYRLRGDVEPKVTEARAIEKIFADYGIKDVWGKE